MTRALLEPLRPHEGRGFSGVKTKRDRPDFMTEEQLDAQPMGAIVHTRQAQFKRTPKGWRPCNSDGRALPRTSDEYASWQLAQEGVSL